MRRTPRAIFGVWLLAPLFLAACASMNKSQCLSADWYAVGVEDGARGRPLEHLGNYRRACAEYGVSPQPERYVAGRNEGLKSFCTYDRGYANGRAGYAFSGVCPDALAANFGAGYRDGHERYELTRRLDSVHEQIRQSKAALKAGIPNPRDRAREVERLEDLTREAEQLEQALAGLPGG
ncbi:MAG: DUF2799 domain-containing protein [Burkholderiales bacterium]